MVVVDDLIDRAWQTYRSERTAPDTSDAALVVLREAFYMGAATAFYTLVALGEDAVDEDTANVILDNVHRELDAFGLPAPVKYVFLRRRES